METDNVIKISPELPMVCPFRTHMKMQNGNEQIVLFPECQGNACPYFNVDAMSNSERCRRAI